MQTLKVLPAKARSPRYPVIGLGEAIERIQKVYAKDHLNTIPKTVVVEHMGYTSLNGASLGIVSAVSKYGLLEGGSEGMKVSDRALAILVHEQGEQARVEAIEAAAQAPTLFEELFQEFPSGASDNALKSYLIVRKKFIPAAATVAIRAFKDTLAVVQAERGAYDSSVAEDDEPEEEPVQQSQPSHAPTAAPPAPPITHGDGPSFNITRSAEGYAIHLGGTVSTQGHADEVIGMLTQLKGMLPAEVGKPAIG